MGCWQSPLAVEGHITNFKTLLLHFQSQGRFRKNWYQTQTSRFNAEAKLTWFQHGSEFGLFFCKIHWPYADRTFLYVPHLPQSVPSWKSFKDCRLWNIQSNVISQVSPHSNNVQWEVKSMEGSRHGIKHASVRPNCYKTCGGDTDEKKILHGVLDYNPKLLDTFVAYPWLDDPVVHDDTEIYHSITPIFSSTQDLMTYPSIPPYLLRNGVIYNMRPHFVTFVQQFPLLAIYCFASHIVHACSIADNLLLNLQMSTAIQKVYKGKHTTNRNMSTMEYVKLLYDVPQEVAYNPEWIGRSISSLFDQQIRLDDLFANIVCRSFLCIKYGTDSGHKEETLQTYQQRVDQGLNNPLGPFHENLQANFVFFYRYHLSDPWKYISSNDYGFQTDYNHPPLFPVTVFLTYGHPYDNTVGEITKLYRLISTNIAFCPHLDHGILQGIKRSQKIPCKIQHPDCQRFSGWHCSKCSYAVCNVIINKHVLYKEAMPFPHDLRQQNPDENIDTDDGGWAAVQRDDDDDDDDGGWGEEQILGDRDWGLVDDQDLGQIQGDEDWGPLNDQDWEQILGDGAEASTNSENNSIESDVLDNDNIDDEFGLDAFNDQHVLQPRNLSISSDQSSIFVDNLDDPFDILDHPLDIHDDHIENAFEHVPDVHFVDEEEEEQRTILEYNDLNIHLNLLCYTNRYTLHEDSRQRLPSKYELNQMLLYYNALTKYSYPSYMFYNCFFDIWSRCYLGIPVSCPPINVLISPALTKQFGIMTFEEYLYTLIRSFHHPIAYDMDILQMFHNLALNKKLGKMDSHIIIPRFNAQFGKHGEITEPLRLQKDIMPMDYNDSKKARRLLQNVGRSHGKRAAYFLTVTANFDHTPMLEGLTNKINHEEKRNFLLMYCILWSTFISALFIWLGMGVRTMVPIKDHWGRFEWQSDRKGAGNLPHIHAMLLSLLGVDDTVIESVTSLYTDFLNDPEVGEFHSELALLLLEHCCHPTRCKIELETLVRKCRFKKGYLRSQTNVIPVEVTYKHFVWPILIKAGVMDEHNSMIHPNLMGYQCLYKNDGFIRFSPCNVQLWLGCRSMVNLQVIEGIYRLIHYLTKYISGMSFI